MAGGGRGLDLNGRVRALGQKFRDPGSLLTVHVVLLVAQILSGIYYVITAIALTGGMNKIVLSLYRDVVALVFLLPAAYFVDKGTRPELSFEIVGHFFLLGLTGIYGSQILLFIGIQYTSAGFSAAMQPSVPVFTAIIAIVFGVEIVHWYRRDGQAKVAGIVICCAGSIIMTFYQGPIVAGTGLSSVLKWTGLAAGSAVQDVPAAVLGPVKLLGLEFGALQFGALCLIGNCLCMATFINLQAPLLRKFPAPTSVTAFSYLCGAVLMAITGIFAVNDSGAWNLDTGIKIGAVIYNGAIASAFNFGVMTWSLTRVGPLFVASYIPVQPICSALMGLIFLGSALYLGSIFGTICIIIGLLLVSWAREESVRLRALSAEIEGGNHAHHDHRSHLDHHPAGIKEPLLQAPN